MSEDYAKGFKDGFAAGLEEGKKLVPRDTVFQPGILGLPNTCQVCGRLQNGIQGYVCYDPRCSSRVTCGVVTGSDSPSYTTGTGANGPAGGLHDGLGKSFW